MVSAVLIAVMFLSGSVSGDELNARLEETQQLIARLEARQATATEILHAIHEHLAIARDYYNELALRETDVTETLQYISERYFYEDSLIADLERSLSCYLSYIYSHRRMMTPGAVFCTEGLSRTLRRHAYLDHLASRASDQISMLSQSSDSLAQYRDSLVTLRSNIQHLREQMQEIQIRIYREEERQSVLRLQLASEIEAAAESASAIEQQRQQLSRFVTQLGSTSSSTEGAGFFPSVSVSDSFLENERGRISWPCRGDIVRVYGVETDPVYGTETVCDGVRIATSSGTSINSIGDGTVLYANDFLNLGRMVVVDHLDGYFTVYANLRSLEVNQSDQIIRGQKIGESGVIPESRSGYYFEIRRAGEPVNPELYMESM